MGRQSRDEHQLLGDLISAFAAQSALPQEFIVGSLSSNVQMRMVADDVNRPRDVFAGSGGQLRASFTIEATVAADSYDWEKQAPAVERIEAMARPIPREPVQATRGARG